MAAKLKLEFYDSNSKAFSQTYNYAAQNATTANVKALMQAIITNGSIFATVPEEMKNAVLIVTTETTYDLS